MAARSDGATHIKLLLLACITSCVSSGGVSPSGTHTLASARVVLSVYDEGHRRAAREGGEGMGGALSANRWAQGADRGALSDAVRTVSAQAQRVMLGFCADDAVSAVDALKCWVSALGLPRGTLHGMDEGGVPRDMSTFGSVYIKYNSLPTASGDPAGSAMLSGYGGEFRGVYFSPFLGDDSFDQYGVLPLDLFAEGSVQSQSAAEPATARAEQAARGSTSASPTSKGVELSVEAVERVVAEIKPDVHAAGGSIRLLGVSGAEGLVTLELIGSARLRNGVELALRANKLLAVRQVVFREPTAGDQS